MLKYYYIDDISKLQCGPFTSNELLRKNIRPETIVWRSGMADWAEAGTLQELNFLFDTKVPAPQDRREEQQTPPPIRQQQDRQNPTYNSGQRYQYDDQHKWDGIIPMPKNWLIESILLTIFCCSPISLVGIFYAVKVETLYGKREYEASQEASRKAKLWTLWGIAFLPVIYMLLFILGLLTALLQY